MNTNREIEMETSKDEKMSGLVWRGLIVGAVCILILPISKRCYKAVRRYRKAPKKTTTRPASSTKTQESGLVASNEPESRPPPHANLIQEDASPMIEAEIIEEMASAMQRHLSRMDSCPDVLINEEDGDPMLEAKYAEMAAAMAMQKDSPRIDGYGCPAGISGVLINQLNSVIEFVVGGPNDDSDSDERTPKQV